VLALPGAEELLAVLWLEPHPPSTAAPSAIAIRLRRTAELLPARHRPVKPCGEGFEPATGAEARISEGSSAHPSPLRHAGVSECLLRR
jgi:hypothetical protein